MKLQRAQRGCCTLEGGAKIAADMPLTEQAREIAACVGTGETELSGVPVSPHVVAEGLYIRPSAQ